MTLRESLCQQQDAADVRRPAPIEFAGCQPGECLVGASRVHRDDDDERPVTIDGRVDERGRVSA
jgi:hypothetical protein